MVTSKDSTMMIGPLPIMDRQKETKSVKVQIPIVGTVESDSGNHLVDIGTVLIIFIVLFGLVRFFKSI